MRRVLIDLDAKSELWAIWEWNRHRYGEAHADEYLLFLLEGIDDIASDSGNDPELEHRPGWRHRTLQRRKGRQGHVVVYVSEPDLIRILHVFHTAQDWRAKV